MASSKIVGIRLAEVIDNTSFKETGKIKVAVPGLIPRESPLNATIMTPFGGLPNSGMQMVPAIGAQGYVMFERSILEKPIWIGAMLRYFGDEFREGWGNPVEADNETDFIIKTQHTSFETKDEPDSSENKIENILKMNENEFTLAKVKQGDSYQYYKETYNMEDAPYQTISIKDDSISIKFKMDEEGDYTNLTLNPSSATIEYSKGSINNKIILDENGVVVDAAGGKSTITMDKDGVVSVSADEIQLGGDNNTGVLYEVLRDFINGTFNKHTHGTPAGPSSPPTKSYTQSSSMKSKKVKLV